MLKTRPVGKNAAALKYDLITAMGCYALQHSNAMQRRILRLITLITARYNWQRDELAIGQREIAKLWHVDERTVKREMAQMRAMNWLVVKRQGARGRVSEYSLAIDRILADTALIYAAIGQDFKARLEPDPVPNNVVPLPGTDKPRPPSAKNNCVWSQARVLLYAQDPAVYSAWIDALHKKDRAGGELTLIAPTKFHAHYVTTHYLQRLLATCQSVDDNVHSLTILEP